jgi:hypothetical protein
MVLVVSALVFGGCAGAPARDSATAAEASQTLPTEDPMTTARAALEALREKRWDAFAALVHPERGICFTPYPEKCRATLTRQRFLELARSGKPNVWGEYDGSGEPMRLSWREYYDKFVYDRDFARAPVTKMGNVMRGSMVYDIAKDYPNSRVVEFHFPSTDAGSPDWASLRLVFEPAGDRWALVLVQHDAWSI